MPYLDMDVAASPLELIGHTPMVRLGRIGAGLDAALIAKLETTNPGGSSKDRPALTMVEAAEAEGLLTPGSTIIEPTSGNTGVGLAIVAAQRGYQCIFVMSDKMAPEKIDVLRAYGAQVVVCPTAVPPEHPDSYYSTAERLTRETPHSFRPDQYSNPNNPRAHYETTGPEIWDQTRGRVTHFVAGAGTGGTICGVGRYLKERNPAVRVIAADPQGSVFSGGAGRPYLTEGVGRGLLAGQLRPVAGRRRRGGERRGRLRDGAPRDATRGPPDRWLGRHRGGRGAAGRRAAGERRGRRGPHPRLGPRATCPRCSTTRG